MGSRGSKRKRASLDSLSELKPYENFDNRPPRKLDQPTSTSSQQLPRMLDQNPTKFSNSSSLNKNVKIQQKSQFRSNPTMLTKNPSGTSKHDEQNFKKNAITVQ